MHTTEIAKEIRKKLKNIGISPRDITVRSSLYSVTVKIKNPEIKIRDVENISKGYENYERCERTGEIMAGGNTFVFVEYQ